MHNIELLRMQLNNLVTQARHDIYLLSSTNDVPHKQQTLQRLWGTISSIHFLSEYLASLIIYPTPALNATPKQQIHPITPIPNQVLLQNNQRTFSIQELSTYDGKNGRPAYVAVNKVVYDVTNNGAWAAATHFGLVAGRDYTNEFSTCHAGQQSVLATLPIVGRLM